MNSDSFASQRHWAFCAKNSTPDASNFLLPWWNKLILLIIHACWFFICDWRQNTAILIISLDLTPIFRLHCEHFSIRKDSEFENNVRSACWSESCVYGNRFQLSRTHIELITYSFGCCEVVGGERRGCEVNGSSSITAYSICHFIAHNHSDLLLDWILLLKITYILLHMEIVQLTNVYEEFVPIF